MAKKGLQYICMAGLGADGTHTGGFYIGPSAKMTAAPATNTTKDFGDDYAVVTDTSVTTGTISIEVNEFTNKVLAKALGHKYNEEKDMVVCNSNDTAPYMGVGCIGVSTGEKPYKAVIYLRVQFKEPSDEHETKQEQVSYTHTTLEGDFYTLENGDYSIKAGFDTEADAKAFIDEASKFDEWKGEYRMLEVMDEMAISEKEMKLLMNFVKDDLKEARDSEDVEKKNSKIDRVLEHIQQYLED